MTRTIGFHFHRFRTCRVAMAAATIALTYAPSSRTADIAPTAATNEPEMFAAVDQVFADFSLDSHVPGLVYGIVANGRLVHVRGIGVQDLESKRAVTPDTLFRIASMTKAFTALTVLKLRDDGKLQLDAPAENIRSGASRLELPNAGLATNTRPRPPEPHRRLRYRRSVGRSTNAAGRRPSSRSCCVTGVSFNRARRHGNGVLESWITLCSDAIITNVSRRPFADTITDLLLKPLGMESSGLRR